MATDATNPSDALLSLADRLDALPPGSAHPRDALSMAHAAGVLRRLAPRVESDDPAVVAKAVGQIRSMRWSGPSAAATLWGEAVDAVAGLGPPAPEGAPGPAAADPRAVIQRALEEAYRRGREDGHQAVPDIASDDDLVGVLNDLMHYTKGAPPSVLCEDFRVTLRAFLSKHRLDEDPQAFASLPERGAALANEVEESGDE